MALHLELVTVERVVFSEDVELLVAPGLEGQLGILPNHAPLLTVLQPGEIRIDTGSEQRHIAVSGGFLEVIGNKVTILAHTAEYADEIDEARAEDAIKRAEGRLAVAEPQVDLERASESLKRSQIRLKVALHRRR